MLITDGGYLSVFNCRFGANYAVYEGGAVYTGGNSLPDFQYCDFNTNSASSYGGAIRNAGASHFWAVNSTFTGNWAWSNGGAINTTAETSLISGCVFNSNYSYTGYSGAVQIYGSGASATIRNCTFDANHGEFGGGVTVMSSATATIGNSIFYANYDDDPTTSDELEQIARYTGGTATISRCLIQGWTAGVTGGIGNFSGDPLFVSVLGNDGIQGTSDDNLRLMRNSPCIDRGALADAPSDPTDLNHNNNGAEMLPFDADGRPRLRDNAMVANVNGSPIDLGAYEAQFGVPGDMNCDGLVNNFDIDPFVIALTDPGTYYAMFPTCDSINGDASGDGLFNNFDITPFVNLLVE